MQNEDELSRSSLSRALTITRREIKDTARDWRIVLPIAILTLIFPWLMDYTARVAVDFVERYNAPEIGPRLVPFLMLVVGFFPTSFSLVIALETFVGEKERNSLEPLLATPLTDGELYVGKMLAALIPPVVASTLGIAIYLIGLYFSVGYRPGPMLLVQVWLLTAGKAAVMVSAAVVISSQTTSVRAANLLASFVIVPMAFLVQAEAIVFFRGDVRVLWLIFTALMVIVGILVRMGLHLFNREEILGREIDQLNLRRAWLRFYTFWVRGPIGSAWADEPWSLARIYSRDVPELLRRGGPALALVGLVAIAAIAIGAAYSDVYRLPPHSIDLRRLTLEQFREGPQVTFMPTIRTDSIFVHNLRSLVFSAFLGVFSFGALSTILLAAPMALVGWLVAQAGYLGYNPALFAAAFFVPHGLFELPAAVTATAFSVRMGAVLMSPPHCLDVGDGLLMALADFVKIFVFVSFPLLLVAAFIEANLTPRVVVALFGG